MTKGRECVICGRRLLKNRYPAHAFPVVLKELGFEGTWAHASCIVTLKKHLEARRKLRALKPEEF